MEIEYNNLEKTNVFSIYLNLDSSTTTEKVNPGVVEEVESKKKGKYSQLWLNIVQLCSRDMEAYIKWCK